VILGSVKVGAWQDLAAARIYRQRFQRLPFWVGHMITSPSRAEFSLNEPKAAQGSADFALCESKISHSTAEFRIRLSKKDLPFIDSNQTGLDSRETRPWRREREEEAKAGDGIISRGFCHFYVAAAPRLKQGGGLVVQKFNDEE
jgi:hypothetical protein